MIMLQYSHQHNILVFRQLRHTESSLYAYYCNNVSHQKLHGICLKQIKALPLLNKTTIKMTRILSLFCIIILLSCCNGKGRLYSQLEHIDSLFCSDNEDSAFIELQKISKNELNEDYEKAYYSLLNIAITSVKEGYVNDSNAINYCINFYSTIKDKRKLAFSYYYKGMIELYNGMNNNALLYFKKAETLEKQSNDPMLRHRIYTNLAFINIEAKAFRLALEYSHKTLDNAKKNKNNYWMCVALNRIANCYYCMGKKDSVSYYLLSMVPYLDNISNIESRAVFMTNIGYALYENNNLTDAELYLKKALSIFKDSHIYLNLSKVHYKQGKIKESDSLLIIAKADADLEERIEIAQFEAEKEEAKGNFQTASMYLNKAKVLGDSLSLIQKTEDILSMQHHYENEIKDKNERNAWNVILITLAILTIAVITLFIYHRKRINRVKANLATTNRKIKEYSLRIKNLEESKHNNEHEKNMLKKKIKELRDNQTKILEQGHKLFNDIKSGGTVNLWHKSDFEKFIEYYRIEHSEAIDKLEKEYSNLTTINLFYLILCDMGYNEIKAQDILGISPGAFRTMKSRIKNKARN